MKRLFFFPLLILTATALLAADKLWQSMSTATTVQSANEIMVVQVNGTNETPVRATLGNLASQMARLSSPQTYQLSSLIGAGDADLSPGSTNYGTLGDVGPQIQAILDQATNGGIKVVFDGKYSVGQALVVHGFTELEGVAGGGLILRSNANNSLLKNASWGLNTTYDTNIVLSGSLVLNGGGRVGTSTNWLQTHSDTNTHWHCVVSFHGIYGFRSGDGVSVIGQRTFAGILGRSINGIVSGTVDSGASPTSNLDGWKLVGPSTNNLFTDITARVGDDAISIMGNDLAPGAVNSGGTGVGIVGLLGWDGGPIEATRVRNLFLQWPTFYGIRIGSKSNWVGQVDIDGVFGRTYSHAILVDNYTEDPDQFDGPDGTGNLGNLTIGNVQARVMDMTYYPATIYINARGGSLTVKDSANDYANPYRLTPFLYIQTNSVWKQIEISGNNLTSIATNQTHYITGSVGGLDDSMVLLGTYGQLSIHDNRWLKTGEFTAGSRAINLFANVGQSIIRDNQVYGYDRLMNPISETFDNIITNSIYEGNQVYPGYYQATSITNTAHGVYDYAAGTSLQAVERDLGKDVNDGTAGSDWFLHGGPGGEATVIIGGRGQNQVPWSTANRRRGYYFFVSFRTNPSLLTQAQLGLKDSDSSDRSFATTSSAVGPLTNGLWYRSEFDTVPQGDGERLIGRVQRKSDGYWLSSNMVWSVSKVAVVEALVTGTNVWRSPVSTIAVGYQAAQSTNGWLTTSNLTWTAKTFIVDSVPFVASTNLATQGFQLGSNTGPIWISGAGAPAQSAPIGSLYSRTDGGPATSLYVNTNGSTGWTASP